MPVFNNVLAGSSAQAIGYDIDQSVRFNSPDSARLTRTAGTATSNDIGTLSFWTKRGIVSGGRAFFSNHADANNRTYVGFDSDKIQMYGVIGGSASSPELVTSQVFRDPAAWYHIVIAVDVTQSTASNRVKIYVNGSQVTDFSTGTYPPQDTDLPLFSKTNMQVGAHYSSSVGDYYDGYFAEYYYIDGQALAPSSFGETNEDTNQWQAIEYDGSYGDNGFYLKFQDSSALGDDSSGNTNDFTVANLVAADRLIDSPTNNFCTLNPINPVTGTFSEGNLKYSGPGGWNQCVKSTMEVPNSGKWGFRVDYSGSASGSAEGSVFTLVGVCKTSQTAFTGGPDFSEGCWYSDSGYVYNFSSTAQTETAISDGDYVEMLIDSDDNSYNFKLNGTSVNTGTIGTTDPISVVIQQYNNSGGAQAEFDFGQRGYEPSDTTYKTLCTDNLSDPSIADPTAHFNTVLYTGNSGSNQSVTGVNFSPDFLWIKPRDYVDNHGLIDSVRGGNYNLWSNSTSAEQDNTGGNDAVTLDSDGFTVNQSSNSWNRNGYLFVAWNWLAAAANTSVSAESIDGTNPTIACTRRTNTTAGFSIVSWEGTGSDGTVAHGLSQAPELIINKSRGDAYNFAIQSFLWNSASDTNILYLNTTAGTADDTNVFQAAPTSTVFSPQGGAWGGIGTDDINYIAYCFHSVDGYSKIGKYTGNGAQDGSFVYTGFRPAFIFIKRITSSGSNSYIVDSKRIGYNHFVYATDAGSNKYLWPDSTAAEGNGTTAKGIGMDILSNGFKFRTNSSDYQASSNDYLYYAIAESPFKYSNAR